MNPLYEEDASSDSRGQRTNLSPASSSTSQHSAERSGHVSRHFYTSPNHNNNNNNYNSISDNTTGYQQHRHRSQRYVHQHHTRQEEESQVNTDDDYLSYTQHYDAGESVGRGAQDNEDEREFANDNDDDDGYFLSAVSGLPSLEVENLTHANRHSGSAGMDEDNTSLMEDFPVPTWSQGSRLGERRIQQAIDQETLELEAAEQANSERGDYSHDAGYWAAARGRAGPRVQHDSSPSTTRRQPGPPPLAPSSSSPPPPLSNSVSAPTAASHGQPLLPSSSASLPATAVAASSGTLQPRMREAEVLADPRNQLLDLVITNTAASVTLGEVERSMQWNARYEPMYGPLLEYLQSYQSIFVVSPVDDRVRLRRLFSIRTTAAVRERRGKASEPPSPSTIEQPLRAHAQQQASASRTRRSRRQRSGRDVAAVHRTSSSTAERRSQKPSLPSAAALAAHIGSVSYSCVGERLQLDLLETVYRRRGYDTAMMHAVLHVTNEDSFHLFLFASGAVVWWGMDRKDHWMVEDDFLSADTHLADGVEHRYVQSEIDALFPIWCSYEVDEQCEDMQIASPLGIQPSAVKPALERLSKVLCFDHYLVPATEPARSLVMLTFSHSLGSSARVDYFEYVTKWSHRHILSIPAEFTGLLDYFSTKRRIARLEGEIEVAQLAIQSIHDTPEVLWEVPWLQAYYDMVEQQNTSQSRLSWFTSRSDTLLEQLSHIKARRHRLFMLGSDVFLIVILILDVMFMTSRLVAKMYFKVEEED